jgi:cell division protein FtsW (lipid II flippase)
MQISTRIKGLFYKLLCLGFGICYIFQVFLNIGGVTKFIPSTGVTLPLVSYGGTSIACTMLMFGIVQGLYMISNRKEVSEDAILEEKESE